MKKVFRLMDQLNRVTTIDSLLHVHLEQTRFYDKSFDGTLMDRKSYMNRFFVLTFKEIDDGAMMCTPLILDIDSFHWDGKSYTKYDAFDLKKKLDRCFELLSHYDADPIIIYTEHGRRIISRKLYTWHEIELIHRFLKNADVGIDNNSYAFIIPGEKYRSWDGTEIDIHIPARDLVCRVGQKYDWPDMSMDTEQYGLREDEPLHIQLIIQLISEFGAWKIKPRYESLISRLIRIIKGGIYGMFRKL